MLKWMMLQFPESFKEGHVRNQPAYLLLDANSLVHDGVRQSATEEDAIASVIQKIERIVLTYRPTTTIVIALDGQVNNSTPVHTPEGAREDAGVGFRLRRDPIGRPLSRRRPAVFYADAYSIIHRLQSCRPRRARRLTRALLMTSSHSVGLRRLQS